MGIEIPESWGGAGATFFMSILAVEALSQVDASAGVIVDVQNTLVNNAILRWGTDDQKERYLPRLASEWVGAYALSEASSASDAFSMTARAERKGNHFLVSGQKLWTTNAAEADLFLVFANADPEKGYQGHHRLHRGGRLAGLQAGEERRTSWVSVLPLPVKSFWRSAPLAFPMFWGRLGTDTGLPSRP